MARCVLLTFEFKKPIPATMTPEGAHIPAQTVAGKETVLLFSEDGEHPFNTVTKVQMELSKISAERGLSAIFPLLIQEIEDDTNPDEA